MVNNLQYSHRYSLTAADMDTRYRMTPNAVLLYYQDCWARYMACLHLAAFDMVKLQRMWVITEFNAAFEPHTALWSDDINVTVWNSEITALRLYADFRVKRSDGTEVAHGHACWTLLDTDTHRLAPLTPFATLIPVMEEITTASHKKKRFPVEGTVLHSIEHKVNPINLDFNGHVNNRTYLNIAMQSANEQFLDSHALRLVIIHWLRETFLGDTLVCRLLRLDDAGENAYAYLHTIARNGEEPAAQVYTEWGPRTVQTNIAEEAVRR